MSLAYVMSNDSITVVYQGKPNVVKKGSPNFLRLRDALFAEDWDCVPKCLTVAKSIEDWAKGRFTVVTMYDYTKESDKTTLYYNGTRLPEDLNKRIIEMATAGEDPNPLFLFWERLSKNPSSRSVQQLWTFLEHEGIPLTKDGCFLAYKAVNADYTDKHTGTINNKPGTINKMERNMISDDPTHACHFGFHVGALEYAKSFGGAEGRLVICKVDPEHVVCIPYDSSYQKMRVCRYEVVGNYGCQLPSTYMDIEADMPEVDKDTNSELEDFNDMDSEQLMDQTIENLRRYATHELGIIGASKIPGGKVTLISKILDTRRY